MPSIFADYMSTRLRAPVGPPWRIAIDGVDQRKLQRYRIDFTPFDTNAQAGGNASAVFGDVNWRLRA